MRLKAVLHSFCLTCIVNQMLFVSSCPKHSVMTLICVITDLPSLEPSLIGAMCPGYRHIKRSMHGTHMMNTGEIREVYGRELVNLKNEGRWCFLNTLFSVSEAVMYMQARMA